MTTFVLVHGSFQGGWIWNPTAAALRKAGHTVFAPTMDGCGERRHALRHGITVTTAARELADLMQYYDLSDVTLAGTSSGGMVIAKTAELARDRIRRLFFVDALAPQEGESTSRIVQRKPDALPYETTEFARGPGRKDLAERLFKDFPPALREWAIERATPHPNGLNDAAPGELDAFWAQPWPDATVIYCRGSENPPEAHQRRTAERLKAKWVEMDADHYPMLTKGEDLARLLQE